MLADRLRTRAEIEPDALAFVVDGAGSLTYRSWHLRSNAVARGLGERGVGPGDRAILWFESRHWDDYAVAYAGVHKAGAFAVPLGPHVPPMDVARTVAHCNASGLVGSPRLLASGVTSTTSVWTGWAAELEDGNDVGDLTDPAPPPELDEISSWRGPLRRPQPFGRPCGEILSDLAALEAAAPSPPGAPWLHAFPPGSDAGRTALWVPLGPAPGPVLAMPTFDPHAFCALTAEHPVARWSLAPSVAVLMLDSDALADHDLTSVVRLVLLTGPVPPRLLALLGTRLPEAALVSMLPSSAGGGLRPAFLYDRGRPASVGSLFDKSLLGLLDDEDEGEGEGEDCEGSDEGQVNPVGDLLEPTAPAGSRGHVEEVITAIWERVLGPRPAGGAANFFELDGDQMDAVRILDLVEDAFEVSIHPSTLLGSPTVSALASLVEDQVRTHLPGRRQEAPVAFSQEGMLWHEQFAPGSQNMPPLVRRYRGPLDAGVLERVLAEIVRRHEPLRTTFEMRSRRPVQVVSPPGDFHLAVRDLSGLAPQGQNDEVVELLADVGRPFDLVEGALFAAELIRLAPDDHIVVLRVHHSVYDDWSVSVFRHELSVLYTAFLAGKASPLPEPALCFGDFSRGQHRRMAGPAGTAELSWWKERLAGAPLCLQLPIDDPNRPEGAPQASPEPVSLELPAGLSAQLRELARRERTTLFMALSAAFQVLLQRYTGQSELLLATVVANRNRTELEQLIGCFTKKVLVRLDGTGDPTFTELLPRVRSALLGALSHQDLPFEEVLQQSLGASAARHGLVPHVAVMFQGVTPQDEEVILPGLETSGYDTSATTARTHFIAGADGNGPDVDGASSSWGGGLYLGTFLILSVIEDGDGISLAARGAFHPASVARMLASFRTLLADIAAHPDRRVSELCLVDDGERAELLRRGDAVGGSPPIGGLAHGAFRAQVERTPSRLAIVDGDHSLTFAELDAQAEALARRLKDLGIGPGGCVGVCARPSALSVTAVLGVWKAGAAYVPLRTDDADAHLTEVVEETSIQVVLSDHRPAVLERLAVVVPIDAVDERVPDLHRPDVSVEPGDEEVAALVVASSGSGPRLAGGERFVVIDHRAVVNLLAGLHGHLYRPAQEPRTGAGLRVCLSAELTDGAFLRQLVALLDGHTLHVVATVVVRGGRTTADEIVSLLGSGDVDLVDCSPSELHDLAGHGLAQALEDRPGQAPTPVMVLGSPELMGKETWSLLRMLPAVRAHHLYGPPECSFGAVAAPVSVADGRLTVTGPLGAGLMAVLDARGKLVPERVTGELHVGGASLARGYLDSPGTTEGRFVVRSLAGGLPERVFRTGQRARRLPGGRIELLGAIADSVDLAGFCVDRARIDAVLGQCAGVDEVRVVLSRDHDGRPLLVAYVVPVRGAPKPTLARLRTELWGRLPGYAWPGSMVVVESLSGLGQQPPTPATYHRADHSESPRGDLLASLWAQVLGVERVDIWENYWQSFSFLDAAALAREAGIPVAGQDVVRNRVLANLAIALAAERQPGRRHP